MAVITSPTPPSEQRFLTAYLDLPFLKQFWKSAPERSPFSSSTDGMSAVWDNVDRFLKRSARIVIDAEEDQLRLDEKLVTYFLHTGQTDHVIPRPGVMDDFSTSEKVYVEDPFSVIMTGAEDIDVQDLRSRTGLLFLRHEDLEEEWPRLFHNRAVDVNDNSPTFQWADLCPHACPLNSIVVADRYAYNQFHSGGRAESFEDNIGGLLDTLLPQGPLDDHVHLTFITDLKPLWEKHRIKPSDVEADLRAFFETRRPRVDFLITVVSYREGSSHKDRFIFTNYGLLTSNDSFSFFKDRKLTKETLVNYIPSAEESSLVARRLKRMKSLQEPWQYGGGDEPVWMVHGDCQNRLFDRMDVEAR